MCSLVLGGGRETKESDIDLSVGLVINKKVGDYVKEGEPLAFIHANSREKLEAARKRFVDAYTFSKSPIEKKPLIRGVVTE
jgi:pyrimidine-nucleoside phosphorylase